MVSAWERARWAKASCLFGGESVLAPCYALVPRFCAGHVGVGHVDLFARMRVDSAKQALRSRVRRTSFNNCRGRFLLRIGYARDDSLLASTGWLRDFEITRRRRVAMLAPSARDRQAWGGFHPRARTFSGPSSRRLQTPSETAQKSTSVQRRVSWPLLDTGRTVASLAA